MSSLNLPQLRDRLRRGAPDDNEFVFRAIDYWVSRLPNRNVLRDRLDRVCDEMLRGHDGFAVVPQVVYLVGGTNEENEALALWINTMSAITLETEVTLQHDDNGPYLQFDRR